MFMTSNYLYIHYFTSMLLGAAHINKFILTNNTCIYIYCNKSMWIDVNLKNKFVNQMFMTSNYYYYITTYYCVSSLPLPYGIRVTTITWLRTTVWAACPCRTAYALLLLNHYVLLCEQPALALRHTSYYYCVSSLPSPYGICVTTITWIRTTVWAACPCPTAYALLLLHDYILLCEELALALRHTRYYY